MCICVWGYCCICEGLLVSVIDASHMCWYFDGFVQEPRLLYQMLINQQSRIHKAHLFECGEESSTRFLHYRTICSSIWSLAIFYLIRKEVFQICCFSSDNLRWMEVCSWNDKISFELHCFFSEFLVFFLQTCSCTEYKRAVW